ncbi:MAG: hypothetical protein WKG06_11555 [Segetibacter sp.]
MLQLVWAEYQRIAQAMKEQQAVKKLLPYNQLYLLKKTANRNKQNQ